VFGYFNYIDSQIKQARYKGAPAALRSTSALFESSVGSARRDARNTRHLQTTTNTGSKDKDLPVGKRIYHIQRLLSEAERIMRQQPPLVWHEDGSYHAHARTPHRTRTTAHAHTLNLHHVP
jgi:hypothetical protein